MRSVTSSPVQSLFMINNPFISTQASFAARRVIEDYSTDEKRVAAAYYGTLGRAPNDKESNRVLAYVHDTEPREPDSSDQPVRKGEKRNKKRLQKRNLVVSSPHQQAWEDVFLALFGCAEFRYIR
jgi:hypothetical protein